MGANVAASQFMELNQEARATTVQQPGSARKQAKDLKTKVETRIGSCAGVRSRKQPGLSPDSIPPSP